MMPWADKWSPSTLEGLRAQRKSLTCYRTTLEVKGNGYSHDYEEALLRVIRDREGLTKDDCNNNKPKSYWRETGSIHGISYSIYTDKSALIGGWRVGCKNNAMQDYQSCTASRGDLDVTIFQGLKLFNPRQFSIHVQGEHSTTTRDEVLLRLDGSPVLAKKGGWRGEEAETIVARLEKAKMVRTAYTPWPNGISVESQINLDGFAEAVSYLQFAVQRGEVFDTAVLSAP
jgi:hypothetical protein